MPRRKATHQMSMAVLDSPTLRPIIDKYTKKYDHLIDIIEMDQEGWPYWSILAEEGKSVHDRQLVALGLLQAGANKELVYEALEITQTFGKKEVML